MIKKLFSWFQLDPRSLAAFRIAIGGCLSFDILQKLVYAREFYTDWGLMPRPYWIAEYMSTWKISFMLTNGEEWFQVLFLMVTLILAVLFTFGIRTRTVQFLLIILLGSVHNRNNLILSCADDLMRLALFWSLLVPLDHHYTLAKKSPPLDPADKILPWSHLGSFLLVLQLVQVYWFSALYKIHPVWTEEYSAVYYTLNIDHLTTAFGKWLKDQIDLGKILTQFTLIWEILGPALLFVPLKSKIWRTLVACGFIGFHIGLALCLNIGTFPWVAIAYWFIFIPGEFWDAVAQTTTRGFAFARIPPRLGQAFATPHYRTSKTMITIFSILMILVTLQNFANYARVDTPRSMQHLLSTLNLNQLWNMFAPYPIRNDGWFVIEGHFKNGEIRDLLTDRKVTFEKPSLVSNLYITAEWRKFYLNLWDQAGKKIMLPFARFLCRSKHAAEGESPLSTLKIFFMKETTPPIGQPFPEVKKMNLWSHDCFVR